MNRILAISILLAAPAAAQTSYSDLVRADETPENWLTYSGNYRAERFTPPRRDHSRERRPPAPRVDLPDQRLRTGGGHSDRRGRRHVRRRAAEHDRRARRPHRPASLAARPRRSRRDAQHRLPAREPRRGRPRRLGVLRDPRRLRGRARPHDRRRPLAGSDGGQQARLRDHRGPSRGGRQGDRRHERRRGRRARVPRRLRRGDRRARLALVLGPRRGRAGQRHLGRRQLEDRRRRHVADRRLRSGPRPPLLGYREPRPRLERRLSARRQPLHRLARGARREHRRAPLALPVHAPRRPRLGRQPDPGARGRRVGRRDAKARDPRQPQRLLLRARPRDRPVPARRPVLHPDVGGADRRERPPGANPEHLAERGGHARVAEPRRLHELVQPVVRPEPGPALRPDPRNGLYLLQERGRVRARDAVPRRRRAAARRRRDLRRGPGAERDHRRPRVGVRAVDPGGLGSHVHRHRRGRLGNARGQRLRARRRHRGGAVGLLRGRRHPRRADELRDRRRAVHLRGRRPVGPHLRLAPE